MMVPGRDGIQRFLVNLGLLLSLSSSLLLLVVVVLSRGVPRCSIGLCPTHSDMPYTPVVVRIALGDGELVLWSVGLMGVHGHASEFHRPSISSVVLKRILCITAAAPL